jgi:hypothetical protein
VRTLYHIFHPYEIGHARLHTTDMPEDDEKETVTDKTKLSR